MSQYLYQQIPTKLSAGCSDYCTLEKEYWTTYNQFSSVVEKRIDWPLECLNSTSNPLNITETNDWYGQSWFLTLNSTTSTTDACVNVGKSYITAQLNLCNGVCSEFNVTMALTELKTIFDRYCVFSRLFSGGSTESEFYRNRTLELQPFLDDFNEGLLQTGPCTWCDDGGIGNYSSAICDIAPMVDCTSLTFSETVCVSLWGWQNNEANTVFLPIARSLFENAFDPLPEDRGQGVFFAPGSFVGVFSDLRNCTEDPTLTWTLGNTNATSSPIQTCPSEDRYGPDCNMNEVADICEIAYAESGEICTEETLDPLCLKSITADAACVILNTTNVTDCQGNLIIDQCEIDSVSSLNCTDPMCDGVLFELRPPACQNCSSTDLNGNLVPDQCEDCNNNNITDIEEINMALATDCNGNLIPDDCEIAEDPEWNDCNNNGILDTCEIDAMPSLDCDENGRLDECDMANQVFFPDCNMNGQIDFCDIANGTSSDCDSNSRPDECDIADGIAEDCDGNSEIDECEFDADPSLDCNNDRVKDVCTLMSFPGLDCNNNTILDECEFLVDCNENLVPDVCDVAFGNFTDCNENSILDVCEITADPSKDCNNDFELDECAIANNSSLDCDSNGILDECDIEDDPTLDCDINGIRDDCEIFETPSLDCNSNDIKDSCEIAANSTLDCDMNGQIDECEIESNSLLDCNLNSVKDACEITDDPSIDCDNNTVIDTCEIALRDCNNNTVIDSCDIEDLTSLDCNLNENPDECDIANMTSQDLNMDGIPDECATFGACCTGFSCIENTSLPMCDSLMGSLLINETCTPDPCNPAGTTTITTTSESSEVSMTGPSTTSDMPTGEDPLGSCCITEMGTQACFDDITESSCITGVFSLLSCDSRIDCVSEVGSESGENAKISRSAVVIMLPVVLVSLCCICSVVVFFSLRTADNFEKKFKRVKNK